MSFSFAFIVQIYIKRAAKELFIWPKNSSTMLIKLLNITLRSYPVLWWFDPCHIDVVFLCFFSSSVAFVGLFIGN